MKKFYKVILLSVLSTSLNAQVNLVPNGDFEQFDTCPNNHNQMYHCIGWSSAGDTTNNLSTPDYFNTCSLNPNLTPPDVSWGYQFPHSGNAYCFIICYREGFLRREYIQAELNDTLIPNTQYFISFYASLAGAPGYIIGTNKLGALFTSYKFSSPDFAGPINFAHVFTDSILTDTLNWFHFKSSFIADSSYRYVTIGNFFDDAHTDTVDPSGIVSQFSGYFIDDICISTDSALCYSPMGIEYLSKSSEYAYPNPADNIIYFTQKNQLKEDVIVYDALGKVFELVKPTNNNVIVNCSHWSEGLYFIKISQKCFKIIVQHK